MPPLPPRDLTSHEVGVLLRLSEGRTSVHRPDESEGHAYKLHVALTNEALWQRIQSDTRNGQIALFTAFASTADQIDAARETLNSAEGKWARDQLFQAAPTARFPKGSHNGMMARIYYSGAIRRVRYAGGAGMMPASDYVMLLARDDGQPFGLHVKTFYATMRAGQPQHRVSVFGRDNALFSEGP